MTTLNDAIQPRDKSSLTLVSNSALDQKPAIPTSADPEFSPLALAPIPPAMGTETDAARQFYRQSVSLQRMPPLPAATVPAAGASSASQAISVINGGTSFSSGATSSTGIDLQTNNVDNPEQNVLNITGSGVSYGPGKGQVEITTPILNYQTIEGEGVAKPVEPILNFLAPILVADNPGNTSTDISVPVFVGDSGVGGVKGLAPAPAAGDYAAGKFLSAGGGYAIPPGTGGAANYQTVQQAGVAKPTEPVLNFLAPITATDNPGNTSTDVEVPVFVGDGGSGGVKGLAPAPAAGDAAAGKFLSANGAYATPPGNLVAFTDKTLSSQISVSGHSSIVLDSIVITFPSYGTAWLIRVNYSYYIHDGTSQVSYVYDGTNYFGLCELTTASGNVTLLGSQMSPTVFTPGSTVTVGVYGYFNGDCTVQTTDNILNLIPSRMQVEVIFGA